MEKDNWIGILIIVGVILAGLYGSSAKNTGSGIFSMGNAGNENYAEQNRQYEIQQKLNEAQRQTEELKSKIAEEENKKIRSKYYGVISISYVSRSADPKYEYVMIRNNGTTTIPITGWTVKSNASGQSVSIPQGTYLYFANSQNEKTNIYLSPNDILYLITGYSPIGVNFKINKCSGYLQQFQSYYPYLPSSCPLPKNENLSSIPRLVINDECLDYIESFPSCKIQTGDLPIKWSYECKNFITEKINYSSCINTHKNDKDFYQNEWRVYLERNLPIWKDRRETVTLYDNNSKVVSSVSY